MSRTPTIEWQVAGACNYDCSYCIQSRRYRRGHLTAPAVEQAIEFFASLDRVFEIKCSGGEPFAHPLYLQRVVPQIMERTAHRISVLTNFSSSHGDLMRFAAMTRGRLDVFSASLHLEHVSLEAFVRKAEWFQSLIELSVHFVVNQVVLPGREDEAERCREALAQHDIHWFAQLYKTAGGVADYPDSGRLLRLVGSRPGPRDANVAPSFRGRLCWAGVDYFVVDKDGDAWACRTAKRHGQRRLGNIYRRDVRRFSGPTACPYDICPCTVPANRGMIEDEVEQARAAGGADP